MAVKTVTPTSTDGAFKVETIKMEPAGTTSTPKAIRTPMAVKTDTPSSPDGTSKMEPAGTLKVSPRLLGMAPSDMPFKVRGLGGRGVYVYIRLRWWEKKCVGELKSTLAWRFLLMHCKCILYTTV